MKVEELKLMCFEGKATAEEFEKTIKKNGLTLEIIGFIMDYYKDDLDVDSKMDFRR